MKMHFGQLQRDKCRSGKREPLKAGVPAWVPPAPVIDQLEKMEREKQKRKGPSIDQPRVEIDMDDPAEQDPRRKEPDDGDRGVAIIEL